MEQFEKLFPEKVSPIVRENAALAEAPGRGRPVILSASKSHGAEDYRLVASWLSERLEKPAP
jgi:cellulose biosynthesis protein BcsQ